MDVPVNESLPQELWDLLQFNKILACVSKASADLNLLTNRGTLANREVLTKDNGLKEDSAMEFNNNVYGKCSRFDGPFDFE